MRIVADENCDRLLLAALRNAGHDVLSIRETEPGEADNRIFEIAQRESRVLLSNDLDFGLLSERERYRLSAVILMRLDRLSRPARARRVMEILETVGTLEGHLLTIEPGRIRTRALK